MFNIKKLVTRRHATSMVKRNGKVLAVLAVVTMLLGFMAMNTMAASCPLSDKCWSGQTCTPYEKCDMNNLIGINTCSGDVFPGSIGACYGAKIYGGNTSCLGIGSCHSVVVYDDATLTCAADTACHRTRVLSGATLMCTARHACDLTLASDGAVVICAVTRACTDTWISDYSKATIICLAKDACQFEGVESLPVMCCEPGACDGIKSARGDYCCAGGDYCPEGQPSCPGASTNLSCPASCNHSEPVVGKYVATLCTLGTGYSDTIQATVASCTAARPSIGSYIAATCITGDSTTVGADTVITSCSTPTDGQYVATPCIAGNATTGADTVITLCSNPTDGQYVATPCIAGNKYIVGNDTVIASCDDLDSSEYKANGCHWNINITEDMAVVIIRYVCFAFFMALFACCITFTCKNLKPLESQTDDKLKMTDATTDDAPITNSSATTRSRAVTIENPIY